MSLWISFFECIINYLLISLTTKTKCKSVLITSTLRGFRGSYFYRSVAGDGSDCKPYPPCPQNTIRNIFNIQRWRAEGNLFFPFPEGVCSLGGGGRDSHIERTGCLSYLIGVCFLGGDGMDSYTEIIGRMSRLLGVIKKNYFGISSVVRSQKGCTGGAFVVPLLVLRQNSTTD